MTRKNDAYSESEKLIASEFEKYIAEKGIEAARGYIDAVKEFTQKLDGFFYRPHSTDQFIENSPSIVKREVKNFYNEKVHLLEISEMLLKNKI